MDLIAAIVLWLFVMNLGIAFGAGLYESRIVVPQWLRYSPESGYTWDAAAAREADVGLKFWAYVATGPLTLLMMAGWVFVWWAPDEVRLWWLIALGATLVERLLTFTYFIPTMIRLMRADANGQAAAKALQWVRLGYVRHAATLAAWLAALLAFWKMGAWGG